MNRLYPVFLKVNGRRVLVVGGGDVAEQKIRSLLDCGADVTVISPSFTPWMEACSVSSGVFLKRRKYSAGDVAGYTIVIAATDDPTVQRQVYSEASSLDIPVNVADEPELCTFYLGSVFTKGDLKVAVSTNGLSPTAGKIIRDRIAGEFGTGYPETIEKIGRLRSSIKETFPDYESRKRVHERYVNGEFHGIAGMKKPASDGRARKIYSRNLEIEKLKEETGILGKVFLVGAGPGDPELITVKGLRLLRSAEVVLYDALVGEELLSEVSSTTELIFVGKRAGARCTKQEEINSILVWKAREGKRVVRLKCGDPFVFGRGGEEVDALRDAGIEVEVVPGITAGTGVPTSIGIPLTHRKEASAVLFVTGHEDPLKEREYVDWASAARADTVVIYMGTKNLGNISAKLISHGVPELRPAAVIFGGTTDEEKVIVGTVSDISEKAGEIETDLPGLVVIGETVRSLSCNSFRRRSSSPEISGQERNCFVEQLFV